VSKNFQTLKYLYSPAEKNFIHGKRKWVKVTTLKKEVTMKIEKSNHLQNIFTHH